LHPCPNPIAHIDSVKPISSREISLIPYFLEFISSQTRASTIAA